MASSVARIGDLTDGPAELEHSGSTGVLVNGQEVAVLGVRVQCHQHGNNTVCSTIITGSPTVFAGGKPMVRLNDQALCGHKVIVGSANVRCA